MARTTDYHVRLVEQQDGAERIVGEKHLTGSSATNEFRNLITLNTNTANVQVQWYTTNFATPTKLMLVEHGGYSFTYSVGANNRHHRVAASGCAFLHSAGIGSLFLSNNNTASGAKPIIEVILVR